MEVKNVDFNRARTDLAAWLGITLRPTRVNNHASNHGKNGWDWIQCVNAIAGSDTLREIEEWRGCSRDLSNWLVDKKLIGLYQVRSLVEVIGWIPGHLSQVEAGKEEDLQNDKPE